MESCSAVEKFLNMAELIERLVCYLGPLSALHLVQSHVVDKETLQKSFSSKVWNQLIKQSPHKSHLLFEEHVRCLVKILKLLKLEEPSKLILPLLDLICEYDLIAHTGLNLNNTAHVVIIRPGYPEPITTQFGVHQFWRPQIISHGGFCLLEEVEGAFGTTLQTLKTATTRCNNGRFGEAIKSRLSRQKEKMTSFKGYHFTLEDNNSGQSGIQYFTNLLQAKEVSFDSLDIGGDLGEEGWRALALAFQKKPNVVLKRTSIAKQNLTESRMEAIMEIWDATTEVFSVHMTRQGLSSLHLPVVKSNYPNREQAWARLKDITKMSENEFKDDPANSG